MGIVEYNAAQDDGGQWEGDDIEVLQANEDPSQSVYSNSSYRRWYRVEAGKEVGVKGAHSRKLSYQGAELVDPSLEVFNRHFDQQESRLDTGYSLMDGW